MIAVDTSINAVIVSIGLIPKRIPFPISVGFLTYSTGTIPATGTVSVQ